MTTMTDLYRYYSADGRLLYIGISLHAAVRASNHRARPWWSDVATITVEHLDDRTVALAAERSAIIDENPLYNVLRGPDRIASTPEREKALAAERARRYRDRKRGGPYEGPSNAALARAKRRLRLGARMHELDPDEQDAIRSYNREAQRRRRRDESGT